MNLSQIETDLKQALKDRNQLKAETLRGLKSRIQSELTKPGAKEEISEAEIFALVRSEIKKRRDASEAFLKGSRPEQAEKEQAEAEVLSAYLPAQMPEGELKTLIEKTVSELSATAADFGKVMGKLKAEVGDKADGAMLAKLLKETLK